MDFSLTDRLIAGLPDAPPAPPPEQGGLGERFGKQIANLPVNIIQGVGQSAVNLLESGNPTEPTDKVNIPNFFDVPKPTTLGQSAVDMVAGPSGLLSTVGQSLVPSGIAGKLGAAMGLEGAALHGLEWGAGFAGPELNRDDADATDVAVATGLGVGQGAFSILPRKKRILPTLALGLIHGLYEGQRRDTTTGVIAGFADTIGGMLPGHMEAPASVDNPIPRSGDLQGTGNLDLGDPQNADQYQLYKQQLAQQEGQQTSQAAQSLGSLKEGVKLISPPPDNVSADLLQSFYENQVDQRIAALQTAPRDAIPHPQLVSPPELITGTEPPPTLPTGLIGDVSTPVRRDWLARGILPMDEGTPDPTAIIKPELPSNVRPSEGPIQIEQPPQNSVATLQPESEPPSVQNPISNFPVEPKTETQSAPEIPARAEVQSIQEPTDAHAEQLAKTYKGMDVGDLKGTLADLDDAIANEDDPIQQASYKSTRALAERILNEKQTAVSVTPKVVAPEITIKQGDRVTFTDPVFKDQMHGKYQGKTSEGQAKVLFDGDSESTKISHQNLKPAEGEAMIPELATLQNAKVKSPSGKIFEDEDLSELEKFLSGEHKASDEPPEEIKEQDLNFEKRTGESSIEGKSPEVPSQALGAINRVSNAIKDSISRHLKISFAEGEVFRNPEHVLAHSKYGGDIELNNKFIKESLGNWHKMSSGQKAFVLGRWANIIGHEVGHTVLSFLSSKNPEILDKLMEAYQQLGFKRRMQILGKYHKSIGIDDLGSLMHAAGADPSMVHAYGYHPDNTKALDFHGLHEFFAEMSSAHIFGKLKEELLPPELKSIWQKVKEFIGGVIGKLFKGNDTPQFDNVNQKLAYQNFQGMMGDLHDAFSNLSEGEYKSLSSSSQDFERELQWQHTVSDMHVRNDIRNQKLNSTTTDYGDSIGKPNLNDKSFATIQSAPGGQMQSNLVGNKKLLQAELIRHLGYGLAGAIGGGYLGPKLTDDQITTAQGVMLGGILGLAGPIMLRRMFQTMPKAGAATFQHLPAGEAFKRLFTMNNLRDLGGDAANGMGSSPVMFVRFLERNMNLHLPPDIFNAVVSSEGPASYALSIASDALKKANGFETTPVIDQAVEDFLRGKSNISDLRQAVGPDPKAQDFANFIETGRTSIGVLQGMLASGLKEGSFKNQVVASLQKGDYLTRMYRAFHDPDYRPSQAQIESVALELSNSNPDYDLSNARSTVEDYLHQINTEQGMFSGGKGELGQKLDAAIFARKNDRLSAVFRDALGEYTDPKEQLMGTIRHIYTNAIAGKFYDQVSSMTGEDGLKMSYTLPEHTAETQSIQAQLLHLPTNATPEQIATLQQQLKNLSYYVPLDSASRYGKLGGKMVNRFVRDQLAGFDSPWGLMDGSIMKGMANFHNYVKVARTALNPLTVIRNMISAPVLMGLARANPFYSKMALGAIKDMTSGLGREMLEQGIYGVDQVRGEFFRSAEQILSGDYNHSTLEGVFKTGLNHVLEFYRLPDMLARGTSYITAKKRFSAQLNLPETDQAVISAARDWTNRYTVNYANVAPLVKTLRQIPLTNLFISFTAEMSRITKNLVSDVFTHPDMGQRVFAAGALGSVLGIPPLLEKASVAALSPQDQKEWSNAQAQLPDYSRDKLKIVTGKVGPGQFRYFDITPILHTNQLLEMMRTVVGRDWKAFAATNPVFGWENTPILNIAAEQISGKDLRTDRPLDTPTRRFQDVVKEIVPPIVPGGYEADRLSQAFSQTDKGTFGLTNQRTGRTVTPTDIVENYLTGARPYTLDTRVLAGATVAQAKRQIANEASYYRDVSQTNLPQSVKDKAAARYSKAVASILEDMNSKLGTGSQ